MSGSDGDISFDINADVTGVVEGMQEIVETAGESMASVVESTQQAGTALDENLGEGAKKAKEHVEELNEETMNLGKSLDEIHEKITGAFEAAGLTAAYEVAEKLVDEFQEMAEKAAAIATLGDVMGTTAEQTQALQHAALVNDASMGRLELTVNRLSGELTKARDGSGAAVEMLVKLGVSTENINNLNYTGYDALMQLSMGLKNASTESDVHDRIIAVLGPRMAGLIPTIKDLAVGTESITEATEKSNALSEDQVAALDHAGKSWKAFKESVSNSVSSLAADYLILSKASQHTFSNASTAEQLAAPFKEGANAADEAVAQILKTRAELDAQEAADKAKEKERQKEEIEEDKRQLEFFKSGTKEKAEAAQALAEATRKYYGDGAQESIDKVKAADAEATKAALAFVEKYNAGQKSMSDAAAEAQEKITVAHLTSAQKILASQNQLHEIDPRTYATAQIAVDQQIEQAEIKLYQTKRDNLHDDGSNNAANAAQRITLNEQIKQSAISLADKIQEVNTKLTSELHKDIDEEVKLRMDAAKETETIEIAAAQEKMKIAQAASADAGKGMGDPMAAAQLQIAAINEILAAQQKLDDVTAAGYAKRLEEGTITADQYADLMQKLYTTEVQQSDKAAVDTVAAQKKAADQVGQDWKTAMTPVATGFASTFDGMLHHTETFQQGMRKIAHGILQEWEKDMITKPLQDWAMRMGRETALKSMAAAEQGSIDKTSHAEGLLMSAEAALKDRANAAAQAAGAAYQSAAHIPYVGWILGPIEAAAAFAAVMAFPIASAAGGMVVDQDQMAMVHENEMILPANISQGIHEKILQKDAPDSSGGGSMNHFNVSAMDSKSFEKFLSSQKNRTSVANMVSKSSQRGNRNVRMPI